ncbi:MAG TPA: hypothetical protein VH183_13595 [Burkholderiaceae bacterium]|nr:hypothetical protein [Burkholderiaceae bacterium]
MESAKLHLSARARQYPPTGWPTAMPRWSAYHVLTRPGAADGD